MLYKKKKNKKQNKKTKQAKNFTVGYLLYLSSGSKTTGSQSINTEVFHRLRLTVDEINCVNLSSHRQCTHELWAFSLDLQCTAAFNSQLI